MANKRQRKKNQKKLGVFEGGIYRGGRPSGVPNLKKTSTGNLVNMYGVAFTPAEKKHLETLANTANRKRKQMLKKEAQLPRMTGGKDSGQTNQQLQLMGRESDFIVSRKHKSLHKFKSHEEYERYIKNLERVNKKDYISERVKLYKRNHMKAIENAFGDDAIDVLMKIRMMPRDKYMQMVQQDEFLEIGYIYDASARAGKLNQLRASLGMKLKEEDMDY